MALDLARLHGATVKFIHVLLRHKEARELLSLAETTDIGDDLKAELQHDAEEPRTLPSAAEMMLNPSVTGREARGEVLEAVGRAVLVSAERRAKEKGVACECLPLADGEPSDEIVAAARDQGVDAVVMGSRGLSAIEAMTFGSASQRVCHQAPCMCIMVH